LKSAFPISASRASSSAGGYVALTTDHVPHLHELAPNLFAGLGYNGPGVAMSTMMGKLLAERVAGAPEEEYCAAGDAHPAHTFPRLAAAGISLAIGWKRLQDRLNLSIRLSAARYGRR